MLNALNHDISRIIAEGKEIFYVMMGELLLWEAVNSCFGSGVWRGELPWKGDDLWKAE